MYFSDRMAEIMEDFEIKEETISFKEEILPSSTKDNICTVNLHKDDIKMENTRIQGKINNFTILKY